MKNRAIFQKDQLKLAKNCFSISFGITMAASLIKTSAETLDKIAKSLNITDSFLELLINFELLIGSVLLFICSSWVILINKKGGRNE